MPSAVAHHWMEDIEWNVTRPGLIPILRSNTLFCLDGRSEEVLSPHLYPFLHKSLFFKAPSFSLPAEKARPDRFNLTRKKKMHLPLTPPN